MSVRKCFFFCELALILILGYVVVVTLSNRARTVEVFSPGSASGGESGVDVRPLRAPAPQFPGCSSIIGGNIFGAQCNIGGTQPLMQSSADVLPSAEEELGLELSGVIAGNPALSRAIIKDTDKNTLDTYRLGQQVGGAQVEEIRDEGVVLIYNGRRMMLKSHRAGSAGSAQLPTPAEPEPKTIAPKTTETKTQPVQTNLSMADRLGVVLREATIEPYVVNDQTDGLIIKDLDKIPAAKNIGLKDGDVIRAVNGHRLRSKQQAFQVFMKAKTQSRMEVELTRDRRDRKVAFSLK